MEKTTQIEVCLEFRPGMGRKWYSLQQLRAQFTGAWRITEDGALVEVEIRRAACTPWTHYVTEWVSEQCVRFMKLTEA